MAARDLTIHKSVTGATFGERTGKGYASVFYELDRHGDMMLPGCYGKSVQRYLESDSGATVMLNHWEPLPIGLCKSAVEDDKGLLVEWMYHSHKEANDAYTVAKERAEHGKGTGLSVGIRLASKGFEEFSNGAQLLSWLEDEGHDMTRVANIEAIRARDSWCWAIKRVDDWFEFSQVCVPANASAAATMIKNVFGGESRADLTTEEHLSLLLAGVEGGIARLESIQELRAKDGRNLSGTTRKAAEKLLERLGNLLSASDVPSATGTKSLRRARAFLLEN